MMSVMIVGRPIGGRWILHVDLDQFLAAVEVRGRPELRGRPVIVGTSDDPTQPRTVVTCASYEARPYGVRAGMALRTAARKCPEAVFLRSDPAAYDAASDEVMNVLRSFPVRVEVWGWDEAFVAADTDDPETLAREVQRAVAERTGLGCSIGIGDTKPRAKMATGFAKPAGIHRLTAANWLETMGARPTDALWGIGNRIAGRLAALGVRTVAELATADVRRLAGAFGPTIGPSLILLARGIGDTDVTTSPRIPRGRSHVVTFPADLVDRAEIAAEVAAIAAKVAADATASDRTVRRVAVTVRTASFFTRTKITTLSEPTGDADVIVGAAQMVLGRFPLDRPVRLLGVRVEFVDEEVQLPSASSSSHRATSSPRR
jgi:DNA polymerase IV